MSAVLLWRILCYCISMPVQRSNPLVELYAEYIDDADAVSDVYGYWLFLGGFLATLAGFSLYLFAPATRVPNTDVRMTMFALLTLAAPLILVGLVMMLPVNRTGVTAAGAGFCISVSGVLAFLWAYPWAWFDPGGVATAVTVLYGIGVGTVVVVAALIPVATGEQSYFGDTVGVEAGAGDSIGTTGTGSVTVDTNQSADTAETGTDDGSPSADGGDGDRTVEGNSDTDDGDRTAERSVDTDESSGRNPSDGATLQTDGSTERRGSETDGTHDADGPDKSDANEAESEAAQSTANTANRAALASDEQSEPVEPSRSGEPSDPDEPADADTESQNGSDHPAGSDLPVAGNRPILLGETTRGALFTVYEDGGDWFWQLLDEHAIARGVQEFDSADATVAGVGAVRDRLRRANVLEFRNSAFRLYQSESGVWRWRLIDEAGTTLADGDGGFDSRDGAEESIHLLSHAASSAPVLDLDGWVVDLSREDRGWWWRLLDEERTELLASAEMYDDGDAASSAFEDRREALTDAQTVVLTDYAIELVEQEDGWGWRVVDEDEDELAETERVFETKSAAEGTVDALQDNVAQLPVTDSGTPAYETTTNADGDWYWRFVTGDGDTQAISPDPAPDRETAETWAAEVDSAVLRAEEHPVDGGAVEVFRVEDGRWAWRLVDDRRSETAESASTYGNPESARAGATRFTAHVADADILSFDGPVFQTYQAVDGDWRWRLVDERGRVVTDSGEEHASREDVSATIPTLKEHAPEAETVEIESTAFELYEGEGGWNWRLMDDRGEAIARGRHPVSSQVDAREAVEQVTELAGTSTVRRVDGFSFRVHATGAEGWVWRLVDDRERPVATSVDEFDTRGEAWATVETFRDATDHALSYVVDEYVIQVGESEGRVEWQIVDDTREPIVTSTTTYRSRNAALEELRDVFRAENRVPVFHIDDAAVLLEQETTGWSWQPIDDGWNRLAATSRVYDTREEAERAIERIQAGTLDATVLDIESVAFGVESTDDGWHWRLVDGNERTVAHGSERTDTRGATIDALEAVRDAVTEASILELDSPAFELHAAQEGWRWQLIDEYGSVLTRSTVSYPSREHTRDAVRFVQDHGTTAETTVPKGPFEERGSTAWEGE